MRRRWVAATAEELVRQRLLACMIYEWGYPSSLLAVEVGLRQMPHLATCQRPLPSQRADILCYSLLDQGVSPLLLIECKAKAFTKKVIQQAASYNLHVKARYIAIASGEKLFTGWFDRQAGMYRFCRGLPAFSILSRTPDHFQ